MEFWQKIEIQAGLRHLGGRVGNAAFLERLCAPLPSVAIARYSRDAVAFKQIREFLGSALSGSNGAVISRTTSTTVISPHGGPPRGSWSRTSRPTDPRTPCNDVSRSTSLQIASGDARLHHFALHERGNVASTRQCCFGTLRATHLMQRPNRAPSRHRPVSALRTDSWCGWPPSRPGSVLALA